MDGGGGKKRGERGVGVEEDEKDGEGEEQGEMVDEEEDGRWVRSRVGGYGRRRREV